jgi:hypothetical protein
MGVDAGRSRFTCLEEVGPIANKIGKVCRRNLERSYVPHYTLLIRVAQAAVEDSRKYQGERRLEVEEEHHCLVVAVVEFEFVPAVAGSTDNIAQRMPDSLHTQHKGPGHRSIVHTAPSQ